MGKLLKSLLGFFRKLFKFIRKYFAIFLIIFIALTPFLMPLIGLAGTWVAMLPSWLSWLPAFVSFFGQLGFPGVLFAALGMGYLIDGDATTGLVKDAVDVAGDIVKEGVDIVTDVAGSVIGNVFNKIPIWLWLGVGFYFLTKGDSDDEDEKTVVEVRDAKEQNVRETVGSAKGAAALNNLRKPA